VSNEFRTMPSHSAEYFGDTRDHWWNLDYLELLAKRLSFDRIRDALDVGCGVGHWGQLLAHVLPADARVIGVDRDPVWVEKAGVRAAARGLAGRFSYLAGDAAKLPCSDASFDLVTCQTLLIHTPDPAAALAEMMRVARPGALILAAEPNNMAGALVMSTATARDSVEAIVGLVRLQLTCERGKAALGEGNNSLGDVLPGLFASCGLLDVQVYMNDKASATIPPYATAEQRAMLEESQDLSQRDFWIWSRPDTRRYFLAGGGQQSAFDGLWDLAMAAGRRVQQAFADGTYSSAGGAIGYVVCGRKPEPADRRQA
jgi:SAM-dependent methyltransferase